jgi:adenylate kinase
MSVIVVTGTPGAGKTTVLKAALEMAAKEYVVVNYGDAMFETAAKAEHVKNRDELRKLPSSTQKKIQRRAAEKIAGKAENSCIIVDTHCTIKTPTGYLPGLPMWVLEALKPEKFVLIEAEPLEIVGRRRKDESRIRDAEVAADIEEHQQANRAIAMAYAALTGATVKIIKNHDDKLEDAARNLVSILE